MPTVDRSMPTYERFLLAAELLGIPPQELAQRLALPLPGSTGRTLFLSATDAANGGLAQPISDEESVVVDVHGKYLGHRIDAKFDQATQSITITSGPLSGNSYKSASRAAIAVVENLNPDREAANTNGRLFWIVNRTGQPLRSLLGRR